MTNSVRLVVAAAALIVLWSGAVSALTFQVEPQTEECFFHEIASGESLKLNFEVIRGGLLDIQVRVYSPQERVILERMAFFSKRTDSGPQAPENDDGVIQLVASYGGLHKFCFDNRMSRWTAKVLTLNLAETEKKDDVIARLEHLGPVVDSVIKISDDLEVIEKLQRHLRVREQIGRDVANTMNHRAQFLAIAESVVLIAFSYFQLNYIRRWFKDTERAGRV